MINLEYHDHISSKASNENTLHNGLVVPIGRPANSIFDVQTSKYIIGLELSS